MDFLTIMGSINGFLDSHTIVFNLQTFYVARAWMVFGLVALLLMSFQDIFNDRKIDDRRNWFMIGATYLLIAAYNANVWLAILASMAMMGFVYVASHYVKSVGRADTNCLLWMTLGFYLLGLKPLLMFFIVFTVVHFAYLGSAKLLELERMPYLPALFFDFLFVALLLGLL